MVWARPGANTRHLRRHHLPSASVVGLLLRQTLDQQHLMAKQRAVAGKLLMLERHGPLPAVASVWQARHQPELAARRPSQGPTRIPLPVLVPLHRALLLPQVMHGARVVNKQHLVSESRPIFFTTGLWLTELPLHLPQLRPEEEASELPPSPRIQVPQTPSRLGLRRCLVVRSR